MIILLLDTSTQANLLLTNLKEVIEKLQSEKNFYKTKVEFLKIDNKRIYVVNKKLIEKVKCLEDKLETLTFVLP